MRWVGVVEAWVAGFGGVEVAVEGLDFDADFGDKVAGEVGGEGGRVVGGGVGEEAGVEMLVVVGGWYWRGLEAYWL